MNLAAAPVEGTICRVWDDVLKEERTFSLENLLEHTKGDWANYIKGVLVEFAQRGVKVPAFNAVIAGNVEDNKIQATESTITLIPENTTVISDINTARSVQKFLDALEDYDDAQEVVNDMELSDEVAEQLAEEEE